MNFSILAFSSSIQPAQKSFCYQSFGFTLQSVILNKLDHPEPLRNLPQLELVLVSRPEPSTASIVAVVANPMPLKPTVTVSHISLKLR
jgi:hypothetical protein